MILAAAAVLAILDGAYYLRRYLPPPDPPELPACRTRTVSESLPPTEPGLVAILGLSGGLMGYSDQLKVYDDGRVVGMNYSGTKVSTVSKDEATQRLLALAGSLAPDVQPRYETCPERTDSIWSGYLFYGHGTRETTAADQAEILRLLREVQRKTWPGFGR